MRREAIFLRPVYRRAPAAPMTTVGARWTPAPPLRRLAAPRACCVLLLAATAVCYANSLRGPFVFDDQIAIVDNQAIRTLVDGIRLDNPRGLTIWTLAVNYLLGELEPLGYHLANVGIHALAGLTLFGLLRRTLTRPKLAPRFAAVADPLALSVALLWVVHPLATSAVTYVCQRFESLAALFYLFGLYAFCRGTESRAERGWLGIVALAYALGLRSKETMITFPFVLLWYDRALIAASWREVWGRKWLYLALVAITLLLAGTPLWTVAQALVSGVAAAPASDAAATSASPYGGDALVVAGMTPLAYLLSQPGAILHYLRLCFWPSPLVLDYGWPLASGAAQIGPPLAVAGLLLAATIWGVFRCPPPRFWPGHSSLYWRPPRASFRSGT